MIRFDMGRSVVVKLMPRGRRTTFIHIYISPRNMKPQRKILSTRLGKEKRSRQKKKKKEEMEDKKE